MLAVYIAIFVATMVTIVGFFMLKSKPKAPKA